MILNYKWASEYLNMAKHTYDSQVKICEKKNILFKEDVERLDKLKLQIWASFSDFVDTYNKINKVAEITGTVAKEDIHLSSGELQSISSTSKIAADIINDTVQSVATGAATGATVGTMASLASAVAVMGVSWVGVPGGFAVATSMAEVYLAALGITVSPLVVFAIPAFIVGGATMEAKSKKELDKAKKIYDDAMLVCQKISRLSDDIDMARLCCNEMIREVNKLNDFYRFKLNTLKGIVEKKKDFSLFTVDEQYTLASTIILLKMLKDTIGKQLFVLKEDGSVKCEWEMQIESIEQSESKRIELIRCEEEKYSSDGTEMIYKVAEDIGKPKESYIMHKTKILSEEDIRIYDRTVYISDLLEIEGKLAFVDCDVCIYNTCKYAIMVMRGQLEFKNCNLRVGKLAENAEILVVDGKLLIHNCVADNLEYNNCISNLLQEKNPSKAFICTHGDEGAMVSIYKSRVSNCQGTFIFAERNASVKIKETIVENHSDNFVCTSFCSSVNNVGLLIMDSEFYGAIPHKVQTDRFGSSEFTGEKNALIIADSIFNCYNSYFHDTTNYLIKVGSTLSDSACNISRCRFENNAFSDNIKQNHGTGMGNKNLFSLTGLVAIDNCDFINTTGLEIGTMSSFVENCPVYIDKCYFEKYAGRLWVEYGSISNSTFKHSEMIIEIAGKNESADRHVSHANSLVFINCTGMSPEPGFLVSGNGTSLISCGSYLEKAGICVKVDNCYYYECKNLRSLVSTEISTFGSFGRTKTIRVGETGNSIYEKLPDAETYMQMKPSMHYKSKQFKT